MFRLKLETPLHIEKAKYVRYADWKYETEMKSADDFKEITRQMRGLFPELNQGISCKQVDDTIYFEVCRRMVDIPLEACINRVLKVFNLEEVTEEQKKALINLKISLEVALTGGAK